jgi:hypothetical protein
MTPERGNENMKREIKAGDKVQYAARFLRSIGTHTGPICFAVGTVAEIERHGGTTLATIDWTTSRMPRFVAVANLVTVADKNRECVD